MPGNVCPFSQFRIVVLSQPMIFATSFCSNPKSSRLSRIASPIVLTTFGYALSLGFLPFNRTRQKSNATPWMRCLFVGQHYMGFVAPKVHTSIHPNHRTHAHSVNSRSLRSRCRAKLETQRTSANGKRGQRKALLEARELKEHEDASTVGEE